MEKRVIKKDLSGQSLTDTEPLRLGGGLVLWGACWKGTSCFQRGAADVDLGTRGWHSNRSEDMNEGKALFSPPPTSLFHTLPELITPPRLPEKNNQVRKPEITPPLWQPSPAPQTHISRAVTPSCHPGHGETSCSFHCQGHSLLALFGKGSWQSPWKGKQYHGKNVTLEPGSHGLYSQLCHLMAV